MYVNELNMCSKWILKGVELVKEICMCVSVSVHAKNKNGPSNVLHNKLFEQNQNKKKKKKKTVQHENE